MAECGYQLRCLNFGKKCGECKRKNKDKKEDYFSDALSLKSQGKAI